MRTPPPRSFLGAFLLTQLLPFLPARRGQVRELAVLVGQLQLAGVEGRPAGQALLGQAPVGGEQGLSLQLHFLELGRKAEREGRARHCVR